MVSFLDEAGRRRKELDDRHRPWRSLTLAGLLDDVAARFPGLLFVLTEQETVSYGELARRSACAGPGADRARRAAR